MIKIIIKDLDNGTQSKSVDIDWLLFGEEDLEFENGETLPLNDFKFFRKEYEICPFESLPDVPIKEGYNEKELRERFYDWFSENQKAWPKHIFEWFKPYLQKENDVADWCTEDKHVPGCRCDDVASVRRDGGG